MYINFWYPVAMSDEVKQDAPLSVQILDLKFVAFRDSDGVPHVLSSVCVHRGGALDRGWVRDSRIICPYHGWEFGGDGHCTKIPTLPDGQKIPGRVKVDSYPTQEKYGIVFAFLGDLPEEERIPLFNIEEYEAEGWRANDTVSFEINAYYERSVENGLDAAHNEFVHPAQGGPSIVEMLKKHPIEVEEMSPWGSGFLQPFGDEGASESTKVLGAGVGTSVAGSEHYGANVLITKIIFDEVRRFHQYFFEAPIDDHHTRIFFVNMRTFIMEEEMDKKLMDMNIKIAGEDIRIVEALDPVRTPNSTTKEMLLPQDKPIVFYRRYLQGWEDKGWRIDQKSYRDQRGDVAFAIPSPGRRESKNWILDTIPLMPAKES
jgi:phenylpropionate dioxygenase-like ring-hydroxylating dioxygenase large terminal subunit